MTTKFLLMLLSTMIGPLSGLIATNLMDYVDNVLKWTDKAPDAVKQAIVIVLAAAIPAANAQWGLHIPDATSLQGLLSEPNIQASIAAIIAFSLKAHKKAAETTPTATK